MIVRLTIVIALLMPWAASRAASASGEYGDLLLAVDPTRNLITGYFESYTGNKQFSCIFYFRGQLNGPSANRIKTWFPEDRDPRSVIDGVINETTVNGKPAVSVTLKEEHGGCWNVERFAADARSHRLSSPGQWNEVRVVASRRAYFHEAPQEAKKRNAYVVTGNVLRVYENRAGWVRAEYVGPDRRRTSGWVKEADLFSAIPPGAS